MKCDVPQVIFLVGMVAAEVIRFPHRMRNKQDRRQRRIADSRVTALEVALSTLGFLGLQVVPLVHALTRGLRFADYRLSPPARAATGLLGTAAFAGALWLLGRAHSDLGRNWSPTLEIADEHTLVTRGVYRYVRHPIYAALWLWVIAQAALLHNWVAGLAGLVAYVPVYVLRVPREERMMLEHFGQEYREYARRTGRVIPRLP